MSDTCGDGQNIWAPRSGKSSFYFHHVLTENAQFCGTHCSESQNLSHPPIGNNSSRVVLQTSEKGCRPVTHFDPSTIDRNRRGHGIILSRFIGKCCRHSTASLFDCNPRAIRVRSWDEASHAGRGFIGPSAGLDRLDRSGQSVGRRASGSRRSTALAISSCWPCGHTPQPA
jgi:hypothetical protein